MLFGNCFTLWTVYSHILCSHDIRSLLLLNTIQVIESIASIYFDFSFDDIEQTWFQFLSWITRPFSSASFTIKGYMCCTNLSKTTWLNWFVASFSSQYVHIRRFNNTDWNIVNAIDQPFNRNDKIRKCFDLKWIFVY